MGTQGALRTNARRITAGTLKSVPLIITLIFRRGVGKAFKAAIATGPIDRLESRSFHF